MAFYRWQQNITDGSGNVLDGAEVEIRDENTGGTARPPCQETPRSGQQNQRAGSGSGVPLYAKATQQATLGRI